MLSCWCLCVRLVFIKGLAAAPTDPTQLQSMVRYWLGCYGLLLPPSFPFLVGVANHPEAEAAQMQVCVGRREEAGSCCAWGTASCSAARRALEVAHTEQKVDTLAQMYPL